MRATMRRWAVAPGAAVAFLVAGGSVAWLAADEGGYFPEAWGAPTLLLLWVAMLALILGPAVIPGRLSVALLGAAAALVTWIGLSTFWSTLPSQSILELERGLLYLAALLAALLLARGNVDPLLGGVLAGITGVCGYALAVRLVPDVFGVAEPRRFQTPALFEPIGYSNSVGGFAALGILLALGFSAEGRSRAARSLGAAAAVPLASVVHFAYGRGAWFAFAAGLVAAMAVAPARGRLASAWLVGPIPFAALGVFLASHAGALNRINPRVDDARRQGLLLFVALVLLGAAAAAARLAAPILDRHAWRARSLVALGTALAVLLVAMVALSRDAPARAASALSPERGASVALGGRDAFWRAAWNAFEQRPVTGLGAGGYEQYWLEHRERARNVRDAHNLYLETLAELGVPGFALLAAVFGICVATGVGARARRLVAAALGALTVYLVHAFVEWDWEIPAMSVPALFVGAALVAARGETGPPLVVPTKVRAGAIAVCLAASAFSVVALLANRAGAAADEALRGGAADQAEAEARRASRWAPWSSHPLRTLANAQLAQNDREGARASARRALSKDDRDWRLWLTLAVASDGSERRRAFERALELNPLSPRIAELRPILGLRSGLGAGS